MFCCGDILLIVLLYCMLGVDLENAYWTIALSAFNVGSKTRPSQVKSSQAKPNQVKSYHTAQKPGMRDMELWSFVNEFVSLRFIIFDRHAVIDVYRHQSFQLFWIYLSNVSGALFQILHHRKCIEKQNITISIAPKRKMKKKNEIKITPKLTAYCAKAHIFIYIYACVSLQMQAQASRKSRHEISYFDVFSSRQCRKKTTNQPHIPMCSSISSAVNNRCQCEIE